MTTISFDQVTSSFGLRAPRANASVSENLVAPQLRDEAQPLVLGALGTAAGTAFALIPFTTLVYAFVAI